MANNPRAKRNLIPFKKGQTGNPNGRPRKLVSSTIKALESAGIKEVTKTEITGVYMRLINCQRDELRELINDRKQSILIITIAKAIAKGKGFEIIEKMLDRSVGKPKQDIGIQVDSAILPTNFTIHGRNPDGKETK